MGIEDHYLAFCFDEACLYILNMKTVEEVKKEGKFYSKEAWIKEPVWNDVKKEKKERPKNNRALIDEMRNNLKKYK